MCAGTCCQQGVFRSVKGWERVISECVCVCVCQLALACLCIAAPVIPVTGSVTFAGYPTGVVIGLTRPVPAPAHTPLLSGRSALGLAALCNLPDPYDRLVCVRPCVFCWLGVSVWLVGLVTTGSMPRLVGTRTVPGGSRFVVCACVCGGLIGRRKGDDKAIGEGAEWRSVLFRALREGEMGRVPAATAATAAAADVGTCAALTAQPGDRGGDATARAAARVASLLSCVPPRRALSSGSSADLPGDAARRAVATGGAPDSAASAAPVNNTSAARSRAGRSASGPDPGPYGVIICITGACGDTAPLARPWPTPTTNSALVRDKKPCRK